MPKIIPLNYRLFLMMVFCIALSGCNWPERFYLKGPTKNSSQELPAFSEVYKLSDFKLQNVKDMMDRIDIQFSSDCIVEDIVPILRDCLLFLYNNFGPPIYRGRVLIVITDNPSRNAYITWKENDDRQRKITLNYYNILKPVWHHFLVHELFHAFYESSEFLRVNPDFIIEGLAVYAQYKYKYRGMTNIQIQKKLYENAIALSPYKNGDGIDFDRPFQAYGEGELKYIYLISGLFFFTQKAGSIKEKIQRLLLFPPISMKKVPFDRIAQIYELAIDDEIFQRSDKKDLALPAPKKYNSNPLQKPHHKVFKETVDTPYP